MFRLAVFFLSLCLSLPLRAEPGWTALAKGLEYREHADKEFIFHLFRIDLARVKLSPILHNSAQTVKDMAQAAKALVAVNANFFDPDKKPLGLVIKKYALLNPLRKVSWWGVFFIENNMAKIVPQNQFMQSPNIETAIQSGPRLIDNGSPVPGLKSQTSARSVLCVQDPTHVVIAISQDAVETSELIRFLLDPLSCRYALNLDGGSSTQLYAKVGKFELELASPVAVPVALGVFKK